MNAVANIGPAGVRRRRRIGVTMFALGALGAGGLTMLDASRTWRLLVFLPFWLGSLGWLQARAKT